jgi:hypothetical protein
VAPFKVGGEARFYTFGDTPPAGSTSSTADEAEESSPPAAELDLASGDTVETSEDLVNLRSEPTTAGSPVAELPLGTQLEITGEPVTADGYTWWPVTVVETGETGFVASPFITPADA